MTKYYTKYRAGMKKGAGGKYYYPKRRKSKAAPKTTTVKKTANALARIGEVKEREDDTSVAHDLFNNSSGVSPRMIGLTGSERFGAQIDACNVFLPTAFTHQEVAQGDHHKDRIEGDSIYARSLSMKFQITYPKGADILQGDHDLFLIHGFCRAPFFPESQASLIIDSDGDGTGNLGSEVKFRLPDRDNITQHTIAEYVLSQVREHLDNKTDRMDWNEKKTKTSFTVLRKKKIFSTKWKTNQSGDSLANLVGGPQVQYHQVTWPMNKKCQFQRSSGFPTASFDNGDCMYPNYSPIPFVVLYNPGHRQQGLNSSTQDSTPIPGYSTAGVIQVRASSKLWYLDA
jgi:hypothetical protein